MSALKSAENCAKICHEANRVLCQSFNDHSQVHWDDAPDWQRASAVAGVETVLNTPKESVTPGMLHEAWSELKVKEGWTYGEVKDAEAKTHPCLVPFSQLPPHQQTKDHLFLAIVRAYYGL